MSEDSQTADPMVAALLRERAGYVGREGKEDRAAAVDEQLRLRGYSPDGSRLDEHEDTTTEAPQTPPPTEAPARTEPPKGRRARSTEKA